MSEPREHRYIPKLKEQLVEGRIDRRDFLRTSTLLGLSAGAAYGFLGKVTGETFTRPAQAAKPKGGTLRLGHRVQEYDNPHTYSWSQSEITRQVCEHLTRTGHDNVTRPNLVEHWEAADDLKSWTFKLRKDVKWHSGRAFNADDMVWNLQHVLNPETGSSVLGLMAAYMMNDAGDAIWDANAIEKIDDHTVRLNTRNPQVAIPEHLFHYPLHILDPEEDGKFGVGSNGTGAFKLVDIQVGEKAVLEAAGPHWRDGPYLDKIIFVDLGDDGSAWLGALASQQVDGVYTIDIEQLDPIKALPHLNLHSVTTAQTAVARMRMTEKPFDDPKVRKALRLAVDAPRVMELAHRGLGTPAEHHHVCPIHPEYAKLPAMDRDVEAAKSLLAEAGHPDGIDVSIDCKPSPAWELSAVQAMVEQWKDANIRVAINVMPGAQYWDVWDKTPFGFTGWTHRPLGVMVLGLAYRTGVPWNESAYSNADFDATLTKAEGTLDIEERRKLTGQLETIMQEDGPIVQPLWRAVFTAYNKKVQGFAMHPTSYIFAEELAIEA